MNSRFVSSRPLLQHAHCAMHDHLIGQRTSLEHRSSTAAVAGCIALTLTQHRPPRVPRHRVDQIEDVDKQVFSCRSGHRQGAAKRAQSNDEPTARTERLRVPIAAGSPPRGSDVQPLDLNGMVHPTNEKTGRRRTPRPLMTHSTRYQLRGVATTPLFFPPSQLVKVSGCSPPTTVYFAQLLRDMGTICTHASSISCPNLRTAWGGFVHSTQFDKALALEWCHHTPRMVAVSSPASTCHRKNRHASCAHILARAREVTLLRDVALMLRCLETDRGLFSEHLVRHLPRDRGARGCNQ